jgi:hypothetical protein
VNDVVLALEGTWKVLLASLLLGAGLPVVFSLGVRALALGADPAADAESHDSTLAGRALASVCFAVVLAGVGLGITYIVASGFGKVLSFEHIYPVLVDKH